jgi:hypothetical protein
MNREAIGIPGNGAIVDLVSDDANVMAADAGKAKEVALGDEEEEDTAVDDGPMEQIVVPRSPLPSASA